MIRKCVKYPFASIIDEVINSNGEELKVVHTDTSLVFRLDVQQRDLQAQSLINDMLRPSHIESLTAEQMKTDDVFSLLNPLQSRFITDNAIRNNVISQLMQEAKKRSEQLAEDKKKSDLKEKYDAFIESLK